MHIVYATDNKSSTVQFHSTPTLGTELVDVALHKPCKQSSEAHGGTAGRAVNGVEDNRFPR